MALRDWLPRRWRPQPGPGQTPVYVDDPTFDRWEVVRDFGDVRTARAWHQALVEAGIEAVLTADWPLDRFGHGDIALRDFGLFLAALTLARLATLPAHPVRDGVS